MKTTNYLLLIVIVLALFSCRTEVKKEIIETNDPAEKVIAKVAEKTIYEKLGGVEGVSKIVDEIVDEHLKNENIKHYFEPLKKNEEYFNQFKNHVKDFLGAGTGGAEQYKGRDMKNAHKGMNLSHEDFLLAIDDILVVLDRNKVDRTSRNELLATLYSLKGVVIGQ